MDRFISTLICCGRLSVALHDSLARSSSPKVCEEYMNFWYRVKNAHSDTEAYVDQVYTLLRSNRDSETALFLVSLSPVALPQQISPLSLPFSTARKILGVHYLVSPQPHQELGRAV